MWNSDKNIALCRAVCLGVVTLLACAAIYCIACRLSPRRRRHRDSFTSRRAHEVYQTSRTLFDQKGGDATYSEYKTTLGEGADPVLYTDVRRLWREGRLSPEEVEKVI